MIPNWIIYIGEVHLAGYIVSVFFLTYYKLSLIKDNDLVSSEIITDILIFSQIWEVVFLAQAFSLISSRFFKNKKE